MPIEITTTIEREVTTTVAETKAYTVRVDQVTMRTSGPDKGEIFGRSSMLDGEAVVDAWDWVVPPADVLPVVAQKANGKLSLYDAIGAALYSFAQVTTRPLR